jgi:hypothetical protein
MPAQLPANRAQRQQFVRTLPALKERSRPTNTQPSSLRKEIPNAARIANCFTKPAQRKQMPQIWLPKISIGKMAFSFTGGTRTKWPIKSSCLSA